MTTVDKGNHVEYVPRTYDCQPSTAECIYHHSLTCAYVPHKPPHCQLGYAYELYSRFNKDAHCNFTSTKYPPRELECACMCVGGRGGGTGKYDNTVATLHLLSLGVMTLTKLSWTLPAMCMRFLNGILKGQFKCNQGKVYDVIGSVRWEITVSLWNEITWNQSKLCQISAIIGFVVWFVSNRCFELDSNLGVCVCFDKLYDS